MEHEIIISVKEVEKKFTVKQGNKETVIAQALHNISLDIKSTDFVILYGPSGCGKSTLLNTILGLEKPDTGTVMIRDKNIYKMSEDERARFRNSKIGIIYQQPLWVKSLNLIYNVAMPLFIQGEYEDSATKKAKKLLIEFGLEERLYNKPSEISGGQQQKASAARALIHNPWIIIADEPTGNLDTHSSDELMNLFQKLNKEKKRTIIMVTHNLVYLPIANRQVAILDGKITGEEKAVEKQIKQEVKTVIGANKS